MNFEHYIVFDLEWNQCPYGKEQENQKLPFEIIEIGAVKLNRDKEMVDEFHSIICPQVYMQMHYRTQEIIGLDIETLKKGELFSRAVRKFLLWCGHDVAFASWGDMDLLELQRNMKYYGLLSLLEGPIRFFDVQKLFAIAYESESSRRSLEYGVDFLGLCKDWEFHRALSDAYYTGQILGRVGNEVIFPNYSIDSYQNPKSKEEELLEIFEGKSKFVSREFESKEEAMMDREVVTTRCFLCGRNARKKIRWFSLNSKSYYCAAWCPKHGYLKGKIRMKRTDEGRFYVVKTVKMSDEAEVERVRGKKEMVRKRRRRR